MTEDSITLAREADRTSPPPTSVQTAVCRCVYDTLRRVYRCAACQAGFGLDRSWIKPVATPASRVLREATEETQ